MIFNTHVPRGSIAPYIESVFHFKDFIPDHSIERVIPTGHVFLIFELDGFKRYTYDNESLKPNKEFEKVWVSGVHKNYISISAHQKSEMFVVQFKPFGARPFFHISIDEITDKIFDATEIFGDRILELREDLLKGETSEEMFQAVELWLNERFDEAYLPDNKLIQVVEKLQSSNSPLPNNGNGYDDIYNHTQKHLIAEFKAILGVTPKYFQRIQRFNELLAKIQRKEKISWSGISAECGYSDQSHFIKEFKHFSGFNPSEFIEEEYNKDEPNFFPLDRE